MANERLPQEAMARVIDKLIEFLGAFELAKSRHSENWGVAPCALIISEVSNLSFWVYRGTDDKGRLIVSCNNCNYKMRINPDTGDLEHLDNPLQALEEHMFWESEISEWREKLASLAEEQGDKSPDAT